MLSEKQVQFYRDQGYVHALGMFSPAEADLYRRECHELAERLSRSSNLEATWGSAIAVAEKTSILHCHNVQFYSGALAKLLTDERLTSAMAQCMGTENVQLHHNKMFIKPPEKGSPFPMHQDAPYFPHHRHSMMAAIIHFDDAPIAKGCLRVVPGSHKLGVLEHETEGGFHLPLSQYPIERALPVEARAGDVLLFSYLTIHGSGVNTSDQARTTLLVQVRDPEDQPVEKTHESRGQGMMLRGIDPTSIYRGME